MEDNNPTPPTGNGSNRKEAAISNNDRLEELVATMTQITSAPDLVARELLELYDYDLEIAITQYFEIEQETDNNERVESKSPSRPVQSRQKSPTSRNIDPSVSPASLLSSNVVIQRRSQRAPVDPGDAVAARPENTVSSFQNWMFWVRGLLHFPLVFVAAIWHYFWTNMKNRTRIHLSFLAYIEKEHTQYLDRAKALFYKGNFNETVRSMDRNRNITRLAIYVHDPADSGAFLHSFLSSSSARRLFGRPDMLLTGVLFNSNEGKYVRRMMASGVDESCFALFSYNSDSKIFNKHLVLTKFRNADQIVNNFHLTLEDLDQELANQMIQREALRADRSLVEMQNREYKESLEKDMKRMAEERRVRAEAEAKVENEKKLAEDAARRLQKIADYREKAKVSAAHYAETNGPARLLLKFPNGARQQIQFTTSDSVSVLFNAAIANEACPPFFAVMSNFPVRVVPCLPEWYRVILQAEGLDPEDSLDKGGSFQSLGLEPNTIVFITNRK